MFIIAIIVITVVVGYIASLKKKRFSVFVYMLAAFFGSLIGTLLSFGDSQLYLDYPIFNIWTVTAVFSIIAVLIAFFVDRGKKVLTIVMIVILLALGATLLYMDSQGGDESVEDIITASTPR